MKTKNILAILAVACWMVGCQTTAENPAEGSVPVAEGSVPVAEAKPEIEYFPLVPEVKWGELNWLQKTTASIAIVPGCILSACANAYLWCAN